MAAGVLAGNRRALARALTRIEDGSTEVVADVVARVHEATGRAALVGVTGSPGVGKSTLVSQLVTVLRGRGDTVAVLAVDPSSPFTGGALLGDRVRMAEHVLDRGVFIRSMASRGHLGGLSWAVPQALTVLDAAGFDVVLLETVGVGQAEVEVAGVTDTVVVVLAPGMGDAIQAAKAGILEIADVFAVNKADRDGADATVRELREMQRLGHGPWLAPIVRTVASEPAGITELADAIGGHRQWLEAEDRLRQRRVIRARMQIREIGLATLRARLHDVGPGAGFDELAEQVADRRLDPYAAAARLLASLDS